MRLTELRVSRVGPFRQPTSIKLDPALTLIVGRNGAGKSTLLASLVRLRQKIRQSQSDFLEKSTFSITETVGSEGSILFLGLVWGESSGEVPDFHSIAVLADTESKLERWASSDFIRLVDPRPDAVAGGGIDGRDAFDDESGAWSARDYAKASGSIQRTIEEAMIVILPGIKSIVSVDTGTRAWTDFVVGEQKLTGPMMSTGTLRAFAILTAIHTAPEGAVLLIEEPEESLHLDAMAVLAEAMVARSGEVQIIVTTHSSEFLSYDGFRPESVRVARRTPEGSVVEPLTPRMIEYMRESQKTIGELLATGTLTEDSE